MIASYALAAGLLAASDGLTVFQNTPPPLGMPRLASAAERFYGHWTGQCRLAPDYQGVSQFPMSLTVDTGSKPGHHQWRIVYETSGALAGTVRDYELVTVDAAKGHYAVDEKNGLMLDAYLADDVLHAPFLIGNAMIVATYTLAGDTLVATMPSFARPPARRTCLTEDPSTCTDTFDIQQIQSCRLTRAAGP